jgi:signal transduction histidine kinase
MTSQDKIVLDKKRLEEMKIMIQVGKFSFNILHDLINPITGLALYLDSIRDEELKNELKPIFETNKEIRDLLKTFQATVDKPGKVEKVNVDQNIRSSIILLRHKAIKNNVSINYGRTTTDLRVKMSRLNFYQIILNLIGNSIDSFNDLNSKNKNRKRSVTISLSENLNNYRLTVADNGSGIRKNNLNKIFNKNFTTKKHGYGIGLYTVKNIIENEIGGHIKIKSEWQVGTKFHIYIPKNL